MVYRLLSQPIADASKSILLLGPRQVGKSTLIQSLKPDLEVNLANRSEFLTFNSNPKELEQRIQARQPRTVFIDEVQKIPTLLDTVQSILDDPLKKGKIKFYLTGSSARKLRRGGANLLPGRLFTYTLGPIASSELQYEANSKSAIETGFLPEVYFSSDRLFQEKLLRSYSATYLTEEIQAEALTRNLEGFSRFIHIAAENSGKSVDYSKLSSRAKISRQSCVRFFEILEDTLVARRISPCHWLDEQGDVELVKHPKFYFFDLGVLNGILGNFVASSDRVGLLTEHLILNQLFQSAQAKDQTIEVSSFRTRGGLEIDFLVKLQNRIWAIEVKTSSASIGSSDLRPLKQLSNYYSGKFESVVVCLDLVEKKIDGIWILSWQKMLKEMGL